jgi:hypothetical protein
MCGAREVTDDKRILRMSFACWVTEATNIENMELILTTFPGQKWFREHALIFPYTYIACLVSY